MFLKRLLNVDLKYLEIKESMKERITDELKPKKIVGIPDRGLLYDYNF